MEPPTKDRQVQTRVVVKTGFANTVGNLSVKNPDSYFQPLQIIYLINHEAGDAFISMFSKVWH